MCFSASASFGAGAVLAVIGIATMKKASSPSQIIFAGIPFLFCVQQVSEGVLWLALSNPGYVAWQRPAIYIFLFVAQVIWPLYVPLSILLLEKKEPQKKLQQLFFGMGALVSLYLAFCLFSYPVDATIVGYHISYKSHYPVVISKIAGLLYIIASVAPSFFSGIKRMWILGTAIFVSYIITAIFYAGYVVSVWCFFASIISICVLIILMELKKGKISSIGIMNT